MKKRKYIVAIAAMALMLTACTGKKAEPINQASDLSGKLLGSLASAAPPDAFIALLNKQIGGEVKDLMVYNRTSDIVAAIISGKIDGVGLSETVADYYIKRNSKLKKIEALQPFLVDVMMFLRAEDTTLKNDLDMAISTLDANGTLAQLKEIWITNLPASNEPSSSEMPKIEGARTVYVGVSGDYSPLDYIAADGRPAGFNVALLSEIADLLKINFELVSIESQAKYSALYSKRIDVIFSQIYNQQIASLFSDKTVMTRSFFSDNVGFFLVKK
jgi:ABC-type amino acid transport substrate-binding protein